MNATNQKLCTITIAGCFIIMRHASGKITRERTCMHGRELQQFIKEYIDAGYILTK